LHLEVNGRGEFLAFCLTPALSTTVSPATHLVGRLFGKVFGDRGHISQALAEQLFMTQGVLLITKARKNMRKRVLADTDKLLLRKRVIIESVNNQLKNNCQIEDTRHRSPDDFLVHLLAGLAAYCHQPKKPSLHRAVHPLIVTSLNPSLRYVWHKSLDAPQAANLRQWCDNFATVK
jgi:hypothetical protein